MIQVLLGYSLDLILGDPYWLYHPVRLIGHLIMMLEKVLLKSNDSNSMKKMKGLILLLIVSGLSFVIPLIIILTFASIHPVLALIIESFMIYQIFATKSLDVETRKVYKALKNNDIDEARKMIAYLVSRDTSTMSDEDVIKAAIETIAENLGDGVIAPMIYVIIGGAPLGWYYKGVNTLDSMVGYKNEKYTDYGYFSAKWDDVLNYVPARITSVMILLAGSLIKLDVNNGFKMLVRDRHNHASPNSAYPESAAAGLLRIQLGGKASYFGKVSIKPTMGDALKPLQVDDLDKMRQLLYATSLCSITVFLLIRLVVTV